MQLKPDQWKQLQTMRENRMQRDGMRMTGWPRSEGAGWGQDRQGRAAIPAGKCHRRRARHRRELPRLRDRRRRGRAKSSSRFERGIVALLADHCTVLRE